MTLILPADNTTMALLQALVAINATNPLTEDRTMDMTDPSLTAMKCAVEMEMHASLSTTTRAKAEAIDSYFPAYEANQARIAELEKALQFYADPEVYKPHPHGPAFDRRDLSYHARAALSAQP